MAISKEAIEATGAVYTEEEIKERERVAQQAEDKLLSLGLKWTYRAINYLVNHEQVSLNQLRACSFSNSDNTVRVDIERAVRLLLIAGLIGSNKITENDYIKAEDKAFEMMEEWRESIGSINTMHVLIVNVMEEKHFFTDSQSVLLLDALALENLQKALAIQHLALSEQARLQQSYNLATN